jgi:spore germination protein YaaH
MKKTFIRIFFLVLAFVFMAAVVLSINVEMNIKIRRKANEILRPYEVVSMQPKVYFVGDEGIYEEPNSTILMDHYDEGERAFISLSWIVSEGITYHVDYDNNQINIVSDKHYISIDSNGNMNVDDQQSENTIEWFLVDDIAYISYDDLIKSEQLESFGIEMREVTENGNIVYENLWHERKTIEIDDDVFLMSDEESLAAYNENRYALNFLYDLKNIFLKEPVVHELKKETVIIEQVSDSTLKVISGDNYVGYIATSENQEFDVLTSPRVVNEDSLFIYDDPIILTWEAVYSYNPNTENILPMKGVNVLSPTWYELTDSNGNVSSKVSTDYIGWADSQNIELWVLVSNAFDIDRTHEFLHDAKARKHFIDFMISEAKRYGFEGINIDFENVYLEDKDALTHFVNEFKWHTKNHGLVLSMDVTIMGGSDNWSKCYDHAKLGKIVDFMIVMTYDEYWASSPVSGPVASYDWVYKHTLLLTEVVKPEKLILGLPTYTRVWRERPSTTIANVMITKSSAIGMEAQNNLIEKYELVPIWDDVDKLYYATFFEEDALVKMWIENAETLSIRSDIVNQLDLAGVGVWRRGFETQDVWDAIYDALY